jgi:N-methylhydantoinase B
VPGRPKGDGFDGHAWWPLFSATPIEYIENYYPVLVERYQPIQDSGGPGLHRGGAGIEKVYRMLEPGQVSIHDDREVVPPWGINGGLHGGTSSKWVIKSGETEPTRIPSKIDNLKVKPGDRVVFKTAGSGGWGDPLDRDAAIVGRDVRYGLVSREQAERDYAVVLTADNHADVTATDAKRQAVKEKRGAPPPFDFGYTPPDRQEAAE